MKEMDEKRLYDAAVKGDVKYLVDLLKEDPFILDRVSFTCSKKTPLHIATICQHAAFVREIVQRNPLLAAELDSDQSSSLHIASAKGYTEIVKVLVSAAPDMCLARDFQGRNPLHLAAINGQAMVFDELMMTSPLAVREKVDRGQTVLHLSVKHKKLQVMEIIMREVINDYEFVNAKNDDGDTVLHLAVRDENFEAVQYITGSNVIDVKAENANGYTALDILKLTPTGLKDTNNYSSIENCLQSKAYNSINRQTQRIKWLTKKRNSIMVVAILIATMAFQAGVTPPGGVWQDNPKDNSHKAGEAVMAHIHPKYYESFLRANTIAFVSSLSTILLLISGLPFRRRLFMWSLMVIMWLTVTSIAVTYAISILEVTPRKDMKNSLCHVIGTGLIVWGSVMGILLVGNTIRLVDRSLQKCGITAWRSRRFRDSVQVHNQNVNQEGV